MPYDIFIIIKLLKMHKIIYGDLMKRAAFKLAARNILCSNNGQAAAVWLIYAFLRTALLAAVLFNIRCMLFVNKYGENRYIPKYAYYIIFPLSIFAGLWIMNSLRLNFHRWFLFNDGRQNFRSFFKTACLKTQFKVFTVHVLFLLYRFFCFLFFLLPFSVAAADFLYVLQGRGIAKAAFAVYTVLIVFLLLSGLYFSTVSMQKAALYDETAVSEKNITVTALLKKSFHGFDGNCFFLAKLRLSFFGWLVLCILIAPIFFTAPYYMQTLAVFKMQSLKNQALLHRNI
jgi:hypothetical protein